MLTTLQGLLLENLYNAQLPPWFKTDLVYQHPMDIVNAHSEYSTTPFYQTYISPLIYASNKG